MVSTGNRRGPSALSGSGGESDARGASDDRVSWCCAEKVFASLWATAPPNTDAEASDAPPSCGDSSVA